MKYVAYYRLCIGKQKEVGLDIETQRKQVRAVVDLVGEGEIIGEYEDIETSDKTNKRVMLQKALLLARRSGAVIVVSSLDRLSHNVNYVTSLMSGDVTFMTAEYLAPQKASLRVFASFSYDMEVIDGTGELQPKLSPRTKYGIKMLNASPFRGTVQHNLTAVAQQKGAEAVKRKALDNVANRRATAVALSLRGEGKNLTQIAFELNNMGLTTAKGKQFQPVQVLRLLDRADKTHRPGKVQGDLFS